MDLDMCPSRLMVLPLLCGVNIQKLVGSLCVPKRHLTKKKNRICYNNEDVHTHFGHQQDVADMLFLMLKYIPRDIFTGVYQGDFMGFGRTSAFMNNTLTYVFPEVIQQKLVIAPHTIYDGSW